MLRWRYPFASHLNFLDPLYIDDDKTPYAPIRYKEIVKECYLISKNINTSYLDILQVTPTERNYMLEFLVAEAKQREEMLAKKKAERAAKKHFR